MISPTAELPCEHQQFHQLRERSSPANQSVEEHHSAQEMGEVSPMTKEGQGENRIEREREREIGREGENQECTKVRERLASAPARVVQHGSTFADKFLLRQKGTSDAKRHERKNNPQAHRTVFFKSCLSDFCSRCFSSFISYPANS